MNDARKLISPVPIPKLILHGQSPNPPEKQTHCSLNPFSSSLMLSNTISKLAIFSFSSSSWSSIPSLRFPSFLEDRHVSPMISVAATRKRKPSARLLAPFSIALYSGFYEPKKMFFFRDWFLFGFMFRVN